MASGEEEVGTMPAVLVAREWLAKECVAMGDG